jgi:hypothetical protein
MVCRGQSKYSEMKLSGRLSRNNGSFSLVVRIGIIIDMTSFPAAEFNGIDFDHPLHETFITGRDIKGE